VTVSTKILEDGEGIEILATDVVHGREIVAELEKIVQLNKVKYHLVDKTLCTEYYVTAEDILSIARLDEEASKLNPNIVVALVESIFLDYSLTELWQDHVQDFILKTKSFADRATALIWVKENI